MPDHLQAVSASRSCLDRVDPRLRIVAALGFSVVVVLADGSLTLAAALAAAVLGFALSGLSPGVALRRLLPLWAVLLVLLVLLPFSTEGATVMEIGPFGLSAEGLRLGGEIFVKGNAVVLGLLALTGSMDLTTLGHALSHLRVPEKLTHLLLFSVRYLDVLHREYLRLRWAMKVRGFRPRMDRHTYRSYGYLIGMLLVRSLDRSERIVAAMKCRGFRGRFYMFDHFAFSRRDVWFAVASAGVVSLLAAMQWTGIELTARGWTVMEWIWPGR